MSTTLQLDLFADPTPVTPPVVSKPRMPKPAVLPKPAVAEDRAAHCREIARIAMLGSCPSPALRDSYLEEAEALKPSRPVRIDTDIPEETREIGRQAWEQWLDEDPRRRL